MENREPVRGAVIPISYDLISDILSEKLGMELKVRGIDSLPYIGGVGFAVTSKDERLPVVEEGVRMREAIPVFRVTELEDGKTEIVMEELKFYGK